MFHVGPTQVGISENEKVDTAAYKAITSPLSTKIHLLTSSEAYIIIHFKIMKEWQKY